MPRLIIEGKGTGQRKRERARALERAARIASLLTGASYQYTRLRLSTDLGVSERTIDRDLNLLRDFGYEIEHNPERGYAFARTPPLPAVPLTLPDVLALTLAAELARDSGDIDTASLGAALARLLDAVPPQARPLLQRELLRRAEGKRAAAGRQAVLAAVQQALLQGRRTRIVYATGSRGGEINERAIEPYAVSPYEGSWMITAYDHRREEVRDFKVDRILSVTLLDETYEVPAAFDMAAYRGPAWGVLRGEAGAPVEIALLFDAEAGRWAEEEQRLAGRQFEPQPDGGVLMRVTTGVTPELVRWILRYGPNCRVLAPDSLREHVKTMAERTVALYQQPLETSWEPHPVHERAHSQSPHESGR